MPFLKKTASRHANALLALGLATLAAASPAFPTEGEDSADLAAFRRSAERVRLLLDGPASRAIPDSVRKAVIAKIHARDIRLKMQDRVYLPARGERDAINFSKSNTIIIGRLRFQAMDEDARVLLAFHEYAGLARFESDGDYTYTAILADHLASPWWICEIWCGVRHASDAPLSQLESIRENWPWILTQGGASLDIADGRWYLTDQPVRIAGASPGLAFEKTKLACQGFLRLSEATRRDRWWIQVLAYREPRPDLNRFEWKLGWVYKELITEAEKDRNCKRVN